MLRFLRRPSLAVAVVSNEPYAVGTAVTVRSLLEALDPAWRVRLTVLDGGLSEESRRKLTASWEGFPVTTRFLAPRREDVAHLKLTGGMTELTYYRLLLPGLLPRERKILYLDSDLLVRGDLAPLWETDLAGRPTAAVRDILISTTLSHIPRHETVGLDPDAPYFSAAVLLMDLDAWRGRKIGQRTIAFIAAHPECIRWWDQDGLNAVSNGDWTEVDPRWNVYAESARLLGWEAPSERKEEIERLVAEQRILHFATRYKPWKHACPHPKTADFLAVLDRTAWRGWRPAPETEEPYPPRA